MSNQIWYCLILFGPEKKFSGQIYVKPNLVLFWGVGVGL